jgi:hypothetical protein
MFEDSIDDVPLDELGDRICELSAHIAAATYRWLRLLAAFDRRNGWAGWGVKSCAHWLSWKCGLDLRSAREKLRVARALDDLPLICESFARGESSYSKVRALTRIATPQTEEHLLVFARSATASHVEKLVRSYRRSVPADEADADLRHERRHLTYRYLEDGSIEIRARLDPEEGALVIKALEKVQDELRVRNRVVGNATDGSAEPRHDRTDALVELAHRELAGADRRDARGDRYQVMVHVDAAALRTGDGICHLDDGPALAPQTVRRLLCDGAIVPVVSGSVGRKTRAIPSALRRALAVRDGGCRFPGCTHIRFVEGHHIEHWADGGRTSLANLILLCPFHHRLLHEGGFRIATDVDGRFTFVHKGGWVLETAALTVEPVPVEDLNAGLQIGPRTITSRWTGERCDYDVGVEFLFKRDTIGTWANDGSAEPSGAACVAVP